MTFSYIKKNCIIEKTHFEVLLYLNNASITQNMRFLYISGFILETSYIMYGKFDHFSTWKCQQLKIH